MGYTTEFEGAFAIEPALSADDWAFLRGFAETRRMKRDPEKLKQVFPDWDRQCFHGDLGDECGYFTGGLGLAGQGHDDSIVDYNRPPSGQPGLWCQWIPDDAGENIVWDGKEKFYSYVEWLEYIIGHFLVPRGYLLYGRVEFQGEDEADFGVILADGDKVVVDCC